MVCIYCGGDLSVTNSRPQKSRNQVWRRRPCKACGAVFTSIEAIDLSMAISVVTDAKNGSDAPEPFNRDKLFISIYKSLQHRPTATEDARGISDTVTTSVIKQLQSGTIARQAIIQTVQNTLQRFDQAAATHYAAFHKT